MCLILQETCCSSLVLKQETCCSTLVLKPWRLDQETSEEKLFTKVRQISRQLRTDSSTAAQQIAIYRGLMRLDRYYLSRYLLRIKKISFSDLIFDSCLCICVGFLFSQPYIYKAYFRDRHIREYKENTWKKVIDALFSLKEATVSLCFRVL